MSCAGDAPSVLVVDDNARNLRFLHDALVAHGYWVHTACSGEEALSRAQAHSFDLILMDVHMPGMSGTEAMQNLKAMASIKTVPIVAVTAQAMKGAEAHLLEAGFDGYISKPVALGELLRNLSTYLGGKGPSARRPDSLAPGETE